MLQKVLDLDGRVEAQRGPARMQLARDAQRVRRTVEEIRIAEADVRGPARELLLDVGEHRFGGHGDELSSVDGHDGAMLAEVLAPARSLHRCNQLLAPVPGQFRVALERRQRRPRRHGRVTYLGQHGGRRAPRRERNQRVSRLAHDMIAVLRQQMLGIERSVEAVERNPRRRVLLPHPRRNTHAELQRGVHRHRDRHQPRFSHRFGRKLLHRDVVRRGVEAGLLQRGHRARHRHRLPSQLVAGDDQHFSRPAHHPFAAGGL